MKNTLTIIAIFLSISSFGQRPPSFFSSGWNQLEESQQITARKDLLSKLEISDEKSVSFVDIRYRKLPFYESARLVEYEVYYRNEHKVYNIVVSNKKLTLLDGRSTQIHAINYGEKLLLESKENVVEYLRFFNSSMKADDGRFLIVASLDEIKPYLLKSTNVEKLQELIVEPKVLSKTNEKTTVKATIIYSGYLFGINLILGNNGNVEMADDIALTERYPMKESYFDNTGGIYLAKNREYLLLELPPDERQAMKHYFDASDLLSDFRYKQKTAEEGELQELFDLFLKTVDSSLELNNQYAGAHHLKGKAYTSINGWSQSLDPLETAIRLDPENSDYYVDYAWALFNVEANFIQVFKNFDIALQKNPDNSYAHSMFGAWYLTRASQKGMSEEGKELNRANACKHFQKAALLGNTSVNKAIEIYCKD